MAKRYPISEQQRWINRWLIDLGGRRPSEAAMEVTSMSAKRRWRLFSNLRRLREAGRLVYEGGRWSQGPDYDKPEKKEETPDA